MTQTSFLLWHGVERAAARFPDKHAVVAPDGAVTYAALVAASERVAGRLTDWGVGRGDLVGLFAPKQSRSVALMLGTGRAGAAYVPVDPAQPAARARLILRDAGVSVLATTSALLADLEPLAEHLPDVRQVILLDAAPSASSRGVPVADWDAVTSPGIAAPPVTATEDDPAYILYTSGSTGRPKGVSISHRNALTFVDWGRETFALTPDDILSNHAPLHFDLSVFDIYGALHSGATVVPVPDRLAPFPAALAQWIVDTAVTVWYSVPSALTRLLLHGELERFDYPRLRAVLFAGEVFPVKHLRGVMERFRHAAFANLFGPTETNVCTWYPVPRPLPDDLRDLPIGAACANIDAFAVTDAGARARSGETGELYVRGPCVMLGYWNLPERTAQALGQNPLHSHFVDPTYRTGDIVRLRPDGAFDFLGRRDHMVKTRGYRVELGEVEHVLNRYPGVVAGAVVAIPDEELGARLRAAVTADGGAGVVEANLLRHCVEHLPRYAVPESVHVLQELPWTSTGKIDRPALVTILTNLQPESGTP